MSIKIKILMAILLLGCLLGVPYGYFQFVKIAGFIGFSYLAYEEFTNKRGTTGILSTICAILLNPFFKIYFNRGVWNTIDIVIAAGLIVWVIYDFVKKSKKAILDK